MKNLIILAHPDDETLGCFSVMGEDTYCLILCDENNRFKETLKLYSGCDFIHYSTKIECLGLKPGTLNLYNQFELSEMILKKIKHNITNYTRVFTHHPDDLHIDHKTLSNIVSVLFRPERVNIKGLFYCFTTNNNNFKPNYFINYIYKHKEKFLDFYVKNKSLNILDKELNLDYNLFLRKKYYNNTITNCYEPFEISFLKD